MRPELKLGVNLSNNLSKYEVFSFQPIEAERTQKYDVRVENPSSVLKIANV